MTPLECDMAPAASPKKHLSRSRPLPRHCCLMILVLALATTAAVASAQLSSEDYYDASCPAALLTIRTAVSTAVLLDRRMGASLLRLHFHDCFVQVISHVHLSPDRRRLSCLAS